uniref:Protein translocase subunit SecY n=1 Tax=Caloglossa intermedia TaxID=100879 RepID=A0A1Z1M681_9FLOR|nr:SecY-type transporter protein [Caloglossa intermedia]ARW61509.1 SecY-type transporter protein [Caloglossa intermedia]
MLNKNSEKKNTLFNKSIITLTLLLICRMGVFIPVPGIKHDEFYQNLQSNSILNFLNIFSGGGFATIGIFALGIIPYINSSIIMQLLIKTIPRLETMQKEEGEIGRQKINQITRYLTLIWAGIQSTLIATWVKPYTFNSQSYFTLDCVVTLTTGSVIVMWLSEAITEYGIGNGSSLLIFQNIISNIPKNKFIVGINNKFDNIYTLIFIIVTIIILLMLSILVQESKRKVSIISARQIGKIDTFNLNTQNYIPLKINQGGVMPIVFASAAMTVPIYITSMIQSDYSNIIKKYFTSNISYLALYSVLIALFSYFYSSIILNKQDIANNLKKMGASIPNIRPGSETIRYLEKILNRLTFIGAIFLFFIAQLPYLMFNFTKLSNFQGLATTSLLILVSVSIDTAKQIQTYLISKQYDNMIE